jgi:hypothetical protein
MIKGLKQNLPIIFLILLSPTIAELLSGSSPPLEFFKPLPFLFLVGLYGGGVLAIRELSVKWEKDWGSILILGAAYGIIEEGLAVKSFFDPNWMDLGILGIYGRFLGVNWVWAVCLTIFHTIFSIALPILIFRLTYPELKNMRLLKDKKLKAVIGIFVAIVIFFNISTYKVYLLTTIATLIIVLILILLAYKVKPGYIETKSITPSRGPNYIGAVGVGFTFIFFIVMYALPYVLPFPLVPIILELFICMIFLIFIQNTIGKIDNTKHKVALCWGLLLPLIILAFIQETNGVFGMAVVGIFFIGFLSYVGRKAIKESQSNINNKKNY